MAGQQQYGGTGPPAPVLARKLLVKKGNAPNAYLSLSASADHFTR